MTSTDNVLTYHVVPRFDIAAKGGPLMLGTVVSDIKRLVPLNRGHFRVEVPSELMYTPVTQKNYKEGLLKARNANLKGWLKACGLPVGASAEIGGSKDRLENVVSCDSIVTTYFDPDPAGAYVKACLGVKPVQDWLNAAKGRTVDLYIITGLKIARNLKFNRSKSSELRLQVEGEATEPHTAAVSAGAGVKVGGKKYQELEFEVDDIIIATRFNKYHCVRHRFRKGTEVKDKDVLDGNMMDDEEEAMEQPEIEFELVGIPEEDAAKEDAANAGENECWVGRDV